MRDRPETVVGEGDPGDDVALRFLYQHCYAAIQCVSFLRSECEFELIVCENHEDLIIKKRDGRYIALPIKTRDLALRPIRATDPPIRAAIAKFCVLDRLFPGCFDAFELVTNHTFWADEENESNLKWLLTCLKARGHLKRLKPDHPLRSAIEALAAAIGETVDHVVSVLLRTQGTGRADTITSVKRDVRDVLAECDQMATLRYAMLQQIANAIIGLARDASTKSYKGPIGDRYRPGTDLEEVTKAQRLAGKCICREDVEEIVTTERAKDLSFEPLAIRKVLPVDELPKDMERMIIKMATGGVETIRIQNMQDLVHSLESLYLRWVGRYGAAEAKQRYDHLMASVSFDYTQARAMTQTAAPYGSTMYALLLELFRQRCNKKPDHVFGCLPEQLMGAAGALTQQCKIWWSPEFDIGSGA